LYVAKSSLPLTHLLGLIPLNSNDELLTQPSAPASSTFDPDRPDFTSYGLACTFWRPTVMPRPDHHSEIELNFVICGSVTYLLGGQKPLRSDLHDLGGRRAYAVA
jgi:hypothetical protein